MTEDEARWAFVQRVRSFIGTPYLWGGKGPVCWMDGELVASPYFGLDCSGLVAVAWSASSWRLVGKPDDHYRSRNTDAMWRELPEEPAPGPDGPRDGALVFWRARKPTHDGDMEHVEVCMGWEWQTIGAIGGDSRVRTLDDALKRRACVDVRPDLRERSGEVAGYRTMPWHLLGAE